MKGQRHSTARDSAIGNLGESQNLALQIPSLGFPSQGEMLESIPFASAISDPQVLPPVVDVLPTSDTAEELRRCEFGVAKDVPADHVPRSLPVLRGQPRSRRVGMQHQPQTNSVSLLSHLSVCSGWGFTCS